MYYNHKILILNLILHEKFRFDKECISLLLKLIFKYILVCVCVCVCAFFLINIQHAPLQVILHALLLTNLLVS